MENHESGEKGLRGALIKKSSRVYLVWLLPLFALVFCVFLVFNAWQDKGFEIRIQFDNAQGIVAGKTNVVYNGIAVGQVSAIEATQNLEKVTATVRMNEKFKPWLTDKTDFWLVKPNVSLSGVTGLETLVSGKYIAMRPDNRGQTTMVFTAREKVPVDEHAPGLHITLLSENLHSVSVGSPVYFHQLEVGKVTGYELGNDNRTIRIKTVIFPKYAHLVRHNSRFWNASGLDFTASLKGITFRTESLASLIRGGIAFHTPDWEPLSAQASRGDQFILYPGFEQARAGIAINIRFPLRGAAIHENTPVMFHGVQVGLVKRVDIADDLDHFTVEAVMNPNTDKLLVKGTYFWTVRPGIGFNGVTDPGALFGGPYISMEVSRENVEKGYGQTVFQGHDRRPFAPVNTEGLNLVLEASSLHGLTENSPVLYREKTIGKVEQTRLDTKGTRTLLDINIFPEYEKLINQSSRFFVQGKVSVNASFSGVNIKAGPLSSLISGGVAVITPDAEAPLLSQRAHVMLEAEKPKITKGLQLVLTASELGAIRKGMPVLYLGIPVGEVVGFRLDNPASRVLIDVVIHSPYEPLVSAQSKFWNVSGLSIEGGLLSGLKMKVPPLEKLISGAIAFATPEPATKVLPEGVQFVLHETEDEQWKKWRPAISLEK